MIVLGNLKQLFWIFLFSFLGEFLSLLSPIAIPGSVIGMVLLFVALHFEFLEMSQVETVGEWLTDNMAILFIPPGVGLMTHFNVIAGVWWQLLIIVIGSTAAMIAFVAVVVQVIKKRVERKRERKQLSVKGGKANV